MNQFCAGRYISFNVMCFVQSSCNETFILTESFRDFQRQREHSKYINLYNMKWVNKFLSSVFTLHILCNKTSIEDWRILFQIIYLFIIIFQISCCKLILLIQNVESFPCTWQRNDPILLVLCNRLVSSIQHLKRLFCGKPSIVADTYNSKYSIAWD